MASVPDSSLPIYRPAFPLAKPPPSKPARADPLERINNGVVHIVPLIYTFIKDSDRRSGRIAELTQKIEILQKKPNPTAEEEIKQAKSSISNLARIISGIHGDLNAQVETFVKFIKRDVEGECKLLGAQDKFTREEINEILALEILIRKPLDKITRFLEKGRVEKGFMNEATMQLSTLYREHVSPLYFKAKRQIDAEIWDRAAQKGAAATAGARVLSEVPYLATRQGASLNQVYVVEGIGVMKKSGLAATEQQELTSNLASIMTTHPILLPDVPLGRSGRPTRSTVPGVTKTQIQRGYTLDDFTSSRRMSGVAKAVIDKLSKEDKERYDKYMKEHPEFGRVATVEGRAYMAKAFAYSRLKNATFFHRADEGEPWRALTFQELEGAIARTKETDEKNFMEGQLRIGKDGEPFRLIKTDPESTPSLDFEKLIRALEFSPRRSVGPQIHFIPVLEIEAKVAYESCERFKWISADEPGRELSFKEVQDRYYALGPAVLSKLTPVSKIKTDKIEIPTVDDLKKALDIPWTTVLPDLITASGTTLVDFQAKPYVKMNLLRRLKSASPEEYDLINKCLSEEAFYQMFFSLEAQFADLHHENVGIVSTGEDVTEGLTDVKFSVSGGAEMSFGALLLEYLDGKISPTADIEYTKDEVVRDEDTKIYRRVKVTYTGTIDTLPSLKSALGSRLKFVLFDTEPTFLEDNDFEIMMLTSNATGVQSLHHYIPLRSIFLEFALKDRPLGPRCLEMIAESDLKDGMIKKWMNGEDRPIFTELSPGAKKEIRSMLDDYLKIYSFSSNRDCATLNDLRRKFMAGICDPAVELWRHIEEDLNHITAEAGDTLESLAKKHHLNIDALQKLNPTLTNFQPLTGGFRVVSKTLDLTSTDPKAVKLRAKIALQLFPRATLRQQKAFFERRERRRNYFSNYGIMQSLDVAKLNGDQLKAKMKQYVSEVSSPLSTCQREDYQLRITACSTFEEARKVYEELMNFCQPTYFNVGKAMYPFLADNYELAQELNPTNPGEWIGDYRHSLESLISERAVSPKAQKIAGILEAAIKSKDSAVEGAAYYGSVYI